MTTLVIAGNKREVVSDAKLYDAREHRVRDLDQWEGPKSAANVTHSPPDAVWLGGESFGGKRNRTEARQTLYKGGREHGHGSGNGAGVRFENSPGITVRRHHSRYAWDPIKFAVGSKDWTVEECLLEHARDDAIESDHQYNGRILRSYIRLAHTLFSVTPGGSRHLDGPVTIELRDSLFFSGNMLEDRLSAWRDRSDRDYSWGHEESGGQLFKVRGFGDRAGGGEGITINCVNCAFMMVHNPQTSWSNLRFFQDMTALGSGNRLYYLVPGGEGLDLIDFKGGKVPGQFQLARRPELWDFVSNDPAGWAVEEARWFSTVWNGEEDDDGDDEKPPPPPLDDPRDLRIAALEDALRDIRDRVGNISGL